MFSNQRRYPKIFPDRVIELPSQLIGTRFSLNGLEFFVPEKDEFDTVDYLAEKFNGDMQAALMALTPPRLDEIKQSQVLHLKKGDVLRLIHQRLIEGELVNLEIHRDPDLMHHGENSLTNADALIERDLTVKPDTIMIDREQAMISISGMQVLVPSTYLLEQRDVNS